MAGLWDGNVTLVASRSCTLGSNGALFLKAKKFDKIIQMTKLKLTIFIILEFIFGIGFGFLGLYVFSYFNVWNDLFYSIIFGFIAGFGFTLIGIGLIGYFYLKQIDRKDDFGESMLLSFFGLVGFSFLYIVITIEFQSIMYLDRVLLILPLTGAIIGFNNKTRHARKKING